MVPRISFDHHNHPYHIRPVRMNEWVSEWCVSSLMFVLSLRWPRYWTYHSSEEVLLVFVRSKTVRFDVEWLIYEMCLVYRFGAGSSMGACHAMGPASIRGLDKIPGWGFFGVFPHLSGKCQEALGSMVPRISFGHHNHRYHISLVRMNEWVNGVYRL